MQALLIAIWRRESGPVQLMHSDQNAEFTSREWAASQREHKLEHFLSRKRNCQENAVAKIFFQFLNQEKGQAAKETREQARHDVLKYIVPFYNTMCKHTNTGILSPVDCENRLRKLAKAGV
jgi:putative transposase